MINKNFLLGRKTNLNNPSSINAKPQSKDKEFRLPFPPSFKENIQKKEKITEKIEDPNEEENELDEKEDNKEEKIKKEIKGTKETNEPKEKTAKYTYYCALCGSEAMTSSNSIDGFPHRRIDDAIICLLKENNIESFLVKDRKIVIRRGKNRYEKQFAFKCKNCGILMAYQSTDFKEDSEENKNKELIMELLNKKERKILYVLNDGIIDNPLHSLLQSEIEKIKSGIITTANEQMRKVYIHNMNLHKFS